METKPLPLESKTPFGKVVGVLWVGERYYLMLSPAGVVSLMPADAVEDPPHAEG